MDIDSFRDQLLAWGITPSLLLVVGAVSLITLFFSSRYLLQWFIGIEHLHGEIRALQAQVAHLHHRISADAQKTAKHETPAPLEPEPIQAPDSKQSHRNQETFRLTH